MSILTPQEAVDQLRLDSPASNYPQLDIILPAISDYLKSATGKDWGTITGQYKEIDPTAKIVASVLLVRWFEDPGMIGTLSLNDPGLVGLIAQLHAKAISEAVE